MGGKERGGGVLIILDGWKGEGVELTILHGWKDEGARWWLITLHEGGGGAFYRSQRQSAQRRDHSPKNYSIITFIRKLPIN